MSFRSAGAVAAVCVAVSGVSFAAPIAVFSDSFETNVAQVSEGALGSTSWTVARSTSRGGASIANTTLELSSGPGTTGNGTVTVGLPINSTTYNSAYKTTLEQNAHVVQWEFNLRQSNVNPGGVIGGLGVAYILAASSAQFGSGNGYAITYGQSESVDPIRLVRYTNGVSNAHTDLLTAASPLDDVGNGHLSLRVTFDPVSRRWSIFGRDDGSSFIDPKSGTLSLLADGIEPGNATSRYTDNALGYTGVLLSFTASNSITAHVDNVSVTLLPEPAGVLAMASLAAVGLRRRRQR